MSSAFAALRAKADALSKGSTSSPRLSSTKPTPPRAIGASKTATVPEPHHRSSSSSSSTYHPGDNDTSPIDAILQNKQQFFAFLDEFFSSRFNVEQPIVEADSATKIEKNGRRVIPEPIRAVSQDPIVQAEPPPVSRAQVAKESGGPPPIPKQTRPSRLVYPLPTPPSDSGTVPPLQRPITPPRPSQLQLQHPMTPPNRPSIQPPPRKAPPIPGTRTANPPVRSSSDSTIRPTPDFEIIPTAYPRSESCAAERLCRWFSPSTYWSPSVNDTGKPWFAGDGTTAMVPDILVDCKEARTQSQMSYTQRFTPGSPKFFSQDGMVLFQDTSVAWFHLTWDERDPMGTVVRQARFRPPPEPWDGERLYAAYELYGDIITALCERAAESQQYVSRGECWDMANDAIQHVAIAAPNIPQPIPSIGRCHGHLIYEGGMDGSGGSWGMWRGGENAIRAGDILEWYDARIKATNSQGELEEMIIGEPEHTAVIVGSYAIPSLSSTTSLPATKLPDIEIVEQSVRTGMRPTKRTMHMRTLMMGKLWIYRPVGWDYLGLKGMKVEWPPPSDVETFTVS